MGWFTNSFKAGFAGSLGSLAAMAIFGALVVLGIVLLKASAPKPAENKPRNTVLMVLGIILIVVGCLPFAPLLGLDALGGLFGGNS